MTCRSHLLSAAALVLASVAIAAAQPTADAAPVRLTLAEAIARAHAASHRLAESQARVDGAQATVRVRQTADLPVLGVSAGYSRTNHIDEFGVTQPDGTFRLIYPDLPNNVRTRVFGQWPIYSGGRTGALERAAEAEARAAEADLTTARADLRLEVIRTYWGLATATDAVRVLEEALARADAHLAEVRSRFDAGLIPPNEVLSSEAQRTREEVQLIEARNLRESQAVELRRLTDLPAGAEIELAEPLVPGTPSAVPGAPGKTPGTLALDSDGIAAQIAEALAQRPERQALAARIEGADERQDAARAGSKPTLSLTGGVDYARPNTRIFPITAQWRTSWDAGINLSWNFWDSGRTAAEVVEAGFAATAIRERLADLDTVVAADVRQRLLDIDSSLAAVRATADGVRSAAEARRVVTERFNVGVATNTEVLDAQVALLEAELERTRALANVRLAEARLDRALGR